MNHSETNRLHSQADSTELFTITKEALSQINVENKKGWRGYLDGPKNVDKIRGKNSKNVTQTQMEVANPEVMDQ